MTTSTQGGPTPASDPKLPAQKKGRIKRQRRERIDELGARYFLVKASTTDKVELGEEAASESEAMVTAFRTGGSFAVVTEWKTNADLSNGQPVIKKEVVRRERK